MSECVAVCAAENEEPVEISLESDGMKIKDFGNMEVMIILSFSIIQGPFC